VAWGDRIPNGLDFDQGGRDTGGGRGDGIDKRSDLDHRSAVPAISKEAARIMTTGKMAEKPGHRLLATHTAYAGWARLLIATIRLADGHTVEREIEDHGEAVCILPYNPVRRTAILVRQMRAPVLFAAGAQETLEAIAGVIENEDAAACVRREAMEEALLDLDAVEHIFTAWTMPGISSERMHFYLGRYAGDARDELRGGVAGEHEDTTAVEFGLADLARMADANELADVKTMLLLQTLRLRQPSLFTPNAPD
jgi:nudix-type nucleoside diphosphatase (YffH/AdpP family)